MTKKLLYLFFILFSLLDLYLTNHFLNNTNIEEFNPIANFIFSNFGLIGLMFLKIYSIMIFTTCCLFIGINHKSTEKKLLIFGLSLIIFVVLYSWYAIYTEHTSFRTIEYYLNQLYFSNIFGYIIFSMLLILIYIIFKTFCFMKFKFKNTKYEDYEFERIEQDE